MELVQKIQVKLVLSPLKRKKNICNVIESSFSAYFAASCYLKPDSRNTFIKIYKIETSRRMFF